MLDAIRNPTDNDLDNEARALESQIPSKAMYYGLRTSYILGPSSSDFYSVESWKNFKQEIAKLSLTDSKWAVKIIDFQESQNLWTCLFFHPDHWSLLVEKDLITENERNSFLNTSIGRILSIPRLPLDIFGGISFFGKCAV